MNSVNSVSCDVTPCSMGSIYQRQLLPPSSEYIYTRLHGAISKTMVMCTVTVTPRISHTPAPVTDEILHATLNNMEFVTKEFPTNTKANIQSLTSVSHFREKRVFKNMVLRKCYGPETHYSGREKTYVMKTSMIPTPHLPLIKHHSGDQIKNNGMCRACGTRTEQMCTQGFGGEPWHTETWHRWAHNIKLDLKETGWTGVG
jgi:hypothetical protein